MSVSAPVHPEHPLMKAWEAHKASPEYANSKRWAASPQDVDGSLWALFLAGWNAAGGLPGHAASSPEAADERHLVLDRYDAGLLSGMEGMSAEWWQDYIRAELGRAHDFYQSQADAASAPADCGEYGHAEGSCGNAACLPGALASAPAGAGEGATLHPRTADLVDRFAAALKDKLAAAEKKYGHSDGWAEPDWMDECRGQLLSHVEKGDPRDVAAYCAFLWHHGERTAALAGEPAVAAADEGRKVTATEDRWLRNAVKASGTLVAPGRLAAASGAALAPAVRPINDNDALLIDNLVRASLSGDSLAIDTARMALRQRMNELQEKRHE